MIKSVQLTNWKSYKDSVLYIDPLTIIIGTNSSGKSNVIDALIFLQRISNGTPLLQAIIGDGNMPSIRGGIDWACRYGTDEFSIKVCLEYENVDYSYQISAKIEEKRVLITKENIISENRKIFYTILRDSNSSTIPTYYWTGNSGKGQSFESSRDTSILCQSKPRNLRKPESNGIIQAVADTFRNIFVLDPIPSHMRDYSPLAEKLKTDGSNIAGVLAALEKTEKQKVEKQLTKYQKLLPESEIKKVWAECVGKFKTDAMLYCKEGWGSEYPLIVDAHGMSDGTLRFLAIVTALLTNPEGGLLVVEEVDNGLHPSRVRVLMSMLQELGKEKNIDVIITTHNPALLDSAGVKMIPFISVAHRDKDGNSELTLLEDMNNLVKYISMYKIGEMSTTGIIENYFKKGN